jgi:hypothetical protein
MEGAEIYLIPNPIFSGEAVVPKIYTEVFMSMGSPLRTINEQHGRMLAGRINPPVLCLLYKCSELICRVAQAG